MSWLAEIISRRWLNVTLLIFICIGIAIVGLHSRSHTRWVQALYIRLSDTESVTYGWIKTPGKPRSWAWAASYKSILVWRKGMTERQFLVFDGWDRPVHPIIRITKDHTGIWLVESNFGGTKVVATLDLNTGEFLDINGQLRDGTMSINAQAAKRSVQKPYPAWATTDEGIILATDIDK